MTVQLDPWTKQIRWETEPLDVPGCLSSIFQLGILPVLCAVEAHSVLVVYCQCCGFCGKTVPREPRSLNSVDIEHNCQSFNFLKVVRVSTQMFKGVSSQKGMFA